MSERLIWTVGHATLAAGEFARLVTGAGVEGARVDGDRLVYDLGVLLG